MGTQHSYIVYFVYDIVREETNIAQIFDEKQKYTGPSLRVNNDDPTKVDYRHCRNQLDVVCCDHCRSMIQILLDFIHSSRLESELTISSSRKVSAIKQAIIAVDGWKSVNVTNQYQGPAPLWLTKR